MSCLPARWPNSIRGINDLPPAQKHAIYHTLIPPDVASLFGAEIDSTAITLRCPTSSSAVEISIHSAQLAEDPLLFLQMGDTINCQLAVLMVVVNDPASPRYNIDVDERGQPTQLGTRGRNLEQERRAMQAGLVPGQVRHGLGIFRAALPIFEAFVCNMGHALFLIEPMFYHNAITFERYGFAYAQGLPKMRTIHQEFLPGGSLYAQLDDSTPFRYVDAHYSIAGRSWAIQDGILGEPFTGVKMYKRVGQHAGVQTFPNARW